MTGKFALLYITTPSKEEATSLGRSLLENKLVACVNIIPKMESMYWWEGKIASAKEVVMIAKTTKKLENKVIKYIEDNHSYDCPCVISLPIEGGSKAFLEWIENNTKN